MAISASSAAFAAWTGTTYTWTGAAGDGLWSTAGNWTTDGSTAATTAPTQTDKAVFGASSGSSAARVDADFSPDGIMYLTIDADYAGSVVIEKDFAVWQEYTQDGGTFTCGAHNFQIGKCAAALGGINPTMGHFYLNAGTFNAPKGKEWRWWSRSHQCYFKVLNAATVTTDDTDFSLRVACAGGGETAVLGGCTFRDFKIWTTATPESPNASGTQVYWTGTNTVTRLFTHDGGSIHGNGENVAYGRAVFRILGDMVVTNVPYSNGAGFYYLFDGEGDQTVHTYVPVTQTRYMQTGGILVDKPSGTLTVTGGLYYAYNKGNFSVKACGLVVRRGTVDMSGLDHFRLKSYNSDMSVAADASVTWPKKLTISDYKCNFSMKDQTFNDFAVAMTDSRLNLGTSTNRVNGNLYVSAGSATGSSGYLDLQGDYYADDTYNATHASSFGGGSAWIWMTNAVDQTIFVTNGAVNSLIIDKPATNRVTVKAKDGYLLMGHTGSVYDTAAGSMRMRSGILDVSEGGIYYKSTHGASLNQTGGTILWGPLGLKTFLNNGGHSSSLNFGTNFVPRLTANGTQGGSNNLSCNTLYVGDFTQDGCTCGGTFYVYGNHAISNDTKNAGSYNLRYVGDGDQRVYFGSNMSVCYGSGQTGQINKTGGTLTLDSDVHVGGSWTDSSFFIYGQGTFDPNGHTFGAAGNLKIASRVLFSSGTGCLTAYRMYVNNGAKFAFELPQSASALPFVTGDTVYMPEEGLNATNTIEVVGRVRTTSPTEVDIIQGTNTLVTYAHSGLTLPTWEFVDHPRVLRPAMHHRSDDKLLYFTYVRRCPAVIILK